MFLDLDVSQNKVAIFSKIFKLGLHTCLVILMIWPVRSHRTSILLVKDNVPPQFFFFWGGILLEMKIREFKKGKHSMNFAYYHRYCVSTKCIKKNNLKEAKKWHAESFLGKTTFFSSSLIIPARIPGL